MTNAIHGNVATWALTEIKAIYAKLDGAREGSMRSTEEIDAIITARMAAQDETNASADAKCVLAAFELSGDVGALYGEVMALRHAPSATYVKVWADAVLARVVL